MVRQERLEGTDWYRTWSDTGKSLLQVETGNVYSETIDHISNSYTYQEVSGEGDQDEISTEELYRELTGEDEVVDDAEEIVNILLGMEEESNDEGTGESIPEND